MKKRIISYISVIAIVATYLLNCSFTTSPYGITTDISSFATAIKSERAALPSHYSSYSKGYLTPTTSQGTTSICWAFVHNELLSANVAKKTGKVIDFSEQAMKFETSYLTNPQSGYLRYPNDGGNEIMSTAYLARAGSVLEAHEPFNESSVRTVNPNKLKRYGYLKNTQMFNYGIYDTRIDNGFVTEETQNMRVNKIEGIQKAKELVYKNGAVGAGIYYDYSPMYENADKTAYYYAGARLTPNHSVTIVGWNDNYSRDNFSIKPEGDGAFLIKNSWGNYHNNGTSSYFYISYYDKFITSQLFASEYEINNTLYDNIYQYDEFGWTGNGSINDSSVLCVTRFNSKKINEAVSAVSTYIAEAGTTVDVYINTGGALHDQSNYKHVKTQYFDAPGYYLIDFNEVKLTRGEYYVALRIRSGNEKTYFAMQTSVRDICPNAENTPDTCYVGSSFSNIVPIESEYLAKVYQPMHCIKSFTVTLKDTAKPSNKVFKDVKKDKWYADEVEYCVSHEVFHGTSENTFEPSGEMTRAMFVKVISNLSGEKIENATTHFTDVKKGKWYEDSIAWAYKNKIVKGVSATEFSPDTPITREQMCVMLINYADYMGIGLRYYSAPLLFTDRNNISDYAKTAVALCQIAGIIRGMPDGSFAPKKTATRAEVASMMTGFCKLYIY